MDKQSILIMLGANLDKYGVPEDEILKNVKMFERYLSSLTPEEYQKEVENIDIDLISENIYQLIQKKANAKPKPVHDTLSDIPVVHDEVYSNLDFDSLDSNNEPVITETKPAAKPDLPVKTMKMIPVEYEHVEKVSPLIDIDSLDEIPSDELPYVKGTPAFWAIFLLTLPLTIPIIIVVFAIFFAAIAAMAVLIVGLIAALIGIVAAGSALGLIGIVYGITQTFSTLPIGLYEIGLGILIGGIAMFSGILIYNFAVRFMPFAIKNTIVFMKFTMKKLKYLFYYLKKESAAQ